MQRQTGGATCSAWSGTRGIAIALIAIYLLVKTLAKEWPTISTSLETANRGLLALAFVLSILGMTGLAVLWRQCLSLFGAPQPLPRVTAWYFAGELGKYLPGGIWPVVGRGELATRGGVSRTVAYASTLISMGVMCIGAALTCGLLSPIVEIQAGHVGPELLLLLLVPLGIIAVHPAVFGRFLKLLTKATKGRFELEPAPWRKMLGLILVSVPGWVAVGAASVVVTQALGFDEQAARVAFAAIAAWIIGFLAVPVPAGAGIRELVFVWLSGLPAAEATAVAAVARVMLIIVDGLGGVIGLLCIRGRNLSPRETVERTWCRYRRREKERHELR